MACSDFRFPSRLADWLTDSQANQIKWKPNYRVVNISSHYRQLSILTGGKWNHKFKFELEESQQFDCPTANYLLLGELPSEAKIWRNLLPIKAKSTKCCLLFVFDFIDSGKSHHARLSTRRRQKPCGDGLRTCTWPIIRLHKVEEVPRFEWSTVDPFPWDVWEWLWSLVRFDRNMYMPMKQMAKWST